MIPYGFHYFDCLQISLSVWDYLTFVYICHFRGLFSADGRSEEQTNISYSIFPCCLECKFVYMKWGYNPKSKHSDMA